MNAIGKEDGGQHGLASNPWHGSGEETANVQRRYAGANAVLIPPRFPVPDPRFPPLPFAARSPAAPR
jgi:hypothetical protein